MIKSNRGRGVRDGELSQDDIAPLENCISAMGKILRYCPELIGDECAIAHTLNQWLSWLPVTDDKEEAAHVYSYLCHLIER